MTKTMVKGRFTPKMLCAPKSQLGDALTLVPITPVVVGGNMLVGGVGIVFYTFDGVALLSGLAGEHCLQHR